MKDPPEETLPAGGLPRLLSEIETLPLRYAPFFSSLTTLWQVSESEVEAVLTRARDERAWKRTGLPGVRRLEVDTVPRRDGAEALLLRFDAGARFPAHRHTGPEIILVLEGSYVDGDHQRIDAGDRQVLEAGTEHELVITDDGPCVAALVSHGIDFKHWPLKPLWRLRQKQR